MPVDGTDFQSLEISSSSATQLPIQWPNLIIIANK
jgi:hypothetical protein